MNGHDYVEHLKNKAAYYLGDADTNPALTFVPSAARGEGLSKEDTKGINDLWNAIKTRKPEIERAIDGTNFTDEQKNAAKAELNKICLNKPEQMISRDHKAAANSLVDDFLDMDKKTLRDAALPATGAFLLWNAIKTGKVQWGVGFVVMACVYLGGLDGLKEKVLDPLIEYGRDKLSSEGQLVASVDTPRVQDRPDGISVPDSSKLIGEKQLGTLERTV